MVIELQKQWQWLCGLQETVLPMCVHAYHELEKEEININLDLGARSSRIHLEENYVGKVQHSIISLSFSLITCSRRFTVLVVCMHSSRTPVQLQKYLPAKTHSPGCHSLVL